MESERRLKSNVTKSLIKGTVALAALSVFLKIDANTLPGYLLFMGVSYALIGAYMYNKGYTTYTIGDTGISIKKRFGREQHVAYSNIQGFGYSQGMLARRFKCGSVFVELKQGKGSHRSPEGLGVVILKDVPDPIGLIKELEDLMGPYAAAPTGSG
ncbi:MAG: PH domain-containing protein [Nitrososphaerota archaeon]|nr:PH domain-containing protein [Nitrososphaerota archaeon]MDG6941904.1 PH domain-containing protein [Nitrososphaerota archaeon]MDG6946923.1 PH domain-containing protein [Nitrososphaerota archaeon]